MARDGGATSKGMIRRTGGGRAVDGLELQKCRNSMGGGCKRRSDIEGNDVGGRDVDELWTGWSCRRDSDIEGDDPVDGRWTSCGRAGAAAEIAWEEARDGGAGAAEIAWEEAIGTEE